MPVLLTLVSDQPTAEQREQLIKIYHDAEPARLNQLGNSQTAEQFVDQVLQNHNRLFYCGLFNERLIAALVVNKQPRHWQLGQLCVRKVTRRRGVGSRLLALTLDAARSDDRSVIIPAEALLTPDHIILQRMGYNLDADGQYYHLLHR